LVRALLKRCSRKKGPAVGAYFAVAINTREPLFRDCIFGVLLYLQRVHSILALVAALPAIWLSIQVFGWIVSGDVLIWRFNVKREEAAGRFWLAITMLGFFCCALFGLALAIFVEAI